MAKKTSKIIFEKALEIAKVQGLRCFNLSDYKTNQTKLKWQCSQGLVGFRLAWILKRGDYV